MPRSHAGRLALLAALAVAATVPASLAAAEVYVPALNPVANDGSRSDTELWILNPGAAALNATTYYLAAESDGTQRAGVVGTVVTVGAGRSAKVTGLGQNGKSGLVAVEVGSSLLVEGRMVTTSPSGGIVIARVPVVSDATKIAAGSKAVLLGLERDPERGRLLHLGIVNAGTQTAQCQLAVFRADGVQLGTNVSVEVKPISLRHFADALGVLNAGRIEGARVEVSCNQPFYPFGASFHWPSSHYMFVTPSNAAPSGGGGSGGPSNPPPSADSVVFERLGLVHEATVSNPKGIVAVTVPRLLSLKRLVLTMEFVPGPWNREKVPGNHAIVWLHRGKFRSNTVANVNAFGPNKYTVKANQNVDLAAGSNTVAEGSLTFVEGQRYHLRYVYDAESQRITATVSSGGQVLKTIGMAGTAVGGRLTVPSTGMVAEFGHYFGQDPESPEVASPRWKYYDLRIEMTPY